MFLYCILYIHIYTCVWPSHHCLSYLSIKSPQGRIRWIKGARHFRVTWTRSILGTHVSFWSCFYKGQTVTMASPYLCQIQTSGHRSVTPSRFIDQLTVELCFVCNTGNLAEIIRYFIYIGTVCVVCFGYFKVTISVFVLEDHHKGSKPGVLNIMTLIYLFPLFSPLSSWCVS